MSERPAVLTAAPPSAAITAAGLVAEAHVASGHWEVLNSLHHGEFLLCGASIDYSTFNGVTPDAPDCQVCLGRDG